MISQFLPADFDASKPIALIAGKGRYPCLTAEAIRKANVPLRLIAFEGETLDELVNSVPADARKIIKVGQLGHMLKAIQKFGAGYALMAGQITPKRLFKGLHPDIKAVKILASLKEKNAETIFGAIAEEIEKIDVLQLDARAFLDSQLADESLMAGSQKKVDTSALEHGIRIAKECARLDIGQGVVVNRGTVLAVEAFEGTDSMIERAGTFGAKEPIFVKTVKPGQDYRFDVPVFGLKTIESLLTANIKTVALEAEKTIILEKDKVLKTAKKQGITLWGYKNTDPS